MAEAEKFEGIASITTGSSYAGTMGESTNVILGMGTNINFGMKSTSSYLLNSEYYFGGHNIVHLAPLTKVGDQTLWGIPKTVQGILFTKNEFNSVEENGVNISNNGIYKLQQGYTLRNRYIYQVTAGFGPMIESTFDPIRHSSNLKQMIMGIIQLSGIFTTFGVAQNVGKLSETALSIISTINFIVGKLNMLYPIVIEGDLQSRYLGPIFKKELYQPESLLQLTKDKGIFMAANNSTGITMNDNLLLQAGAEALQSAAGQTDIAEYDGYRVLSKSSSVELSKGTIQVQAQNIEIGFPSTQTSGFASRPYSKQVLINSEKFVYLSTSSSVDAASKTPTNGFYVDAGALSDGVTIKNSTASIVMKDSNITIETTSGQKILMTKDGISFVQNPEIKIEVTSSQVEIKNGQNSNIIQAALTKIGNGIKVLFS